MAVPTATSTSYYVGTVPYVIQLQGADADGSALVFTIVTPPAHGTITGLNSATGVCTYTPTAAYLGADSLQFKVTSGGQDSNTATVGLTVVDKKTTVSDVLLDGGGNPLAGKVTFIRTGFAEGAPGLVASVPSVSAILDVTGRFTVELYPSTSLNPVQYYQLWYENLSRREMLGLYQVPPNEATLALAACNPITDTNLKAKYTFASATMIESLAGTIRQQLGVDFGAGARVVNRLQHWSGATVVDSKAKRVGNNVVADGLMLDSETFELTDNPLGLAEAWVDSNGLGVAIGLDGQTYGFGGAASQQAGVAFDGSGNAYFARKINGKMQICRSVGGVVTQLTTIGENFSPVVNGSFCYYARLDYRGTLSYRRIDTSTLADTLYLGNWNATADYHHLLITGQSLSVGYQASPALTTAQPYQNKMFNAGINPGGTGLTSLIPLIESTVETPASAAANGLFATNNEGQLIVVSGHGVSGTAYVGIKKGTAAFSNGQAQVTAARSIALAAGKTYRVSAVNLIHGETDHQNGNTGYQANLVEFQGDYETDSKAITGQTGIIPMFLCQVASWTKYGQATSLIPIAQLAAAEANPTKIFVVAPKYFLAYQADGIHLTNQGENKLGQYYAKAMAAYFTGATWSPLRPLSVTRSGNVITVQFFVPGGQLVFDTTSVSNPGNYGFEYTDAGSPPAITNVAITAFDTVQITLASTPTGGSKKLRYAYTGTANANAGPTTGARGCLRDTDTLPDWCVNFEKVVS